MTIGVGWASWCFRDSDGAPTLAWERLLPRFALARLFKRVAALYLSLRCDFSKSSCPSTREGRGTTIFATCIFFFNFFVFFFERPGGGGLDPSWPTPRLNILHGMTSHKYTAVSLQ